MLISPICYKTSVDPNLRLYQVPRGIKSPQMQTSYQIFHSYQPDLPMRLPRLEVQQQEDAADGPPQNRKTKSLIELYEQTPILDEQLQFALFSYEPTSFNEAVKDAQWVTTMNQEIDAIEKNQTWDLVDIPVDKTSIGVKWVYKTKLNEKGELEKNKARLVAKGYAQKYDIDYDETFAPVARMDTISAILAIAAQNQWM